MLGGFGAAIQSTLLMLHKNLYTLSFVSKGEHIMFVYLHRYVSITNAVVQRKTLYLLLPILLLHQIIIEQRGKFVNANKCIGIKYLFTKKYFDGFKL